ncbi:hypothetical protein HJFPF1_06528 [Paramyrothecium foliicola]|nr:hypothetical protein HJFPF1_06528 [Paramyrothecium foliicola]
MTRPQVNGDVPNAAHSSAFFEHLLSYPVVSDSIDKFKANEYGQRSIQLGDSAYKNLAAPILPWFAKPYEYVSPYVSRADSLGAQTLDKIDEQFPIVKKPTADLYNDTKSLILLPYVKSLESKDHAFQVYNNEYKKSEQKGLVNQGRAAFTTAIVLSNETLSWISSFLAAKKQQGEQVVNEKVNQ